MRPTQAHRESVKGTLMSVVMRRVLRRGVGWCIFSVMGCVQIVYSRRGYVSVDFIILLALECNR